MKRILISSFFAFITMICVPVALAQGATDNLTHSELDRVILQISEQQQVTSETANLIINLDANIEESNLPQARSEILEDLNQIVAGEWLITRFNYTQDSSGLIRLFGQAEVRLPEHLLTEVYTKTKDISRPGMSYRVQTIDVSVPQAELEKAQENLRQKIYERINKEVTALQKAFPDQHYHVNLINFGININQLLPPKTLRNGDTAQAAYVSQSSFGVSDTLKLTATVVLAADRAN